MKIGNAKVSGTAEQITLFHAKLKKLATNPRPKRETLASVGEANLQEETRTFQAGAFAVRTYYHNSADELCFVEESFSHPTSALAAFNRVEYAHRVEYLCGVRVEHSKGASLLGERARLVEFPSQSSCIGA